MDLFQIQLDSPNGVFFPGEEISGKVLLKLRESIKARAITMQIEGKAWTYWTVSESRSTSSTDSKGNSTSSSESVSVPYKAQVTYMDLKVILWQPVKEDEQKIPFGMYTFPFSFIVPVNCPPSFEGTIGFIRYSCNAKIDRPWKLDDKTSTIFTVIPQFDLNTIQFAISPIVREISKNIGVLFFKHGTICAKIFLPKSGYVPGEIISLRLEIANGSSKNVVKVKCKLVEVGHYTANRCGHHHFTSFPHASVLKRDERRNILKTEDDCNVLANSNGEWSREIQVPSLVPSFNVCPIIQVDYQLQLKLVTNGTFGKTVKEDVPLIVGTIPIRQNQNPFKFSHSDGHPQPTAPNIEDDYGPPPSYMDSVFGHGNLQDEDGNNGENNSAKFTPKYAFYNNI